MVKFNYYHVKGFVITSYFFKSEENIALRQNGSLVTITENGDVQAIIHLAPGERVDKGLTQ